VLAAYSACPCALLRSPVSLHVLQICRDVSSNQLTGSIPESWTDHHWREQPNAFLNFSRNQLTGPFPTSWSLEGHPDWLQASAVSMWVVSMA